MRRRGPKFTRRLALISTLVSALAGLATLPVTASAAATEVQRPMERVEITPPAPRGYSVAIQLYPLRDLATLTILKGPRVFGYLHDRHSSVSYVAVDEGEFDGYRVDVTFPGVGHLEGRFVSDEPISRKRAKPFCRGQQPIFEVGHLLGRLNLYGDGYPPLRRSHARASVSRSFELQCRRGYAKNPPKRSLFDYIGGSRGLGFFNDFEDVLSVEDKSRRRSTEFLAIRETAYDKSSTLKAATYEFLPDEEVAIRSVEAGRVARSSVTVGPPAHRPAEATVRAVSPFTGIGIYHRSSASITGNLSVRFPGRTVRIGGKQSEARLLVAQ